MASSQNPEFALVSCGGLIARGSSAAPSLTYPPQKEGRKHNEKKLEIRTGRPLTYRHHHRQNRLKLKQINAIYCLLATTYNIEKLQMLPCHPYPPTSPQAAQGNGGYCQAIALVSATALPCSMWVPLIGCCPSQTEPAWASHRQQLSQELL